MNTDTMPSYRTSPIKECVSYIKEYGLSLFDNSDCQIKNKGGLIYKLPNKEVVLLPTNLNPEYPGIIFKDINIFKYYRDLNFFPIPTEWMSWNEYYYKEIKNFRTNKDFYWNSIINVVNVELPFGTENEIKEAFLKIKSFLRIVESEISYLDRYRICASYGLAVTDFVVDNWGYELKFREYYNYYNPCIEVWTTHEGNIFSIVDMGISWLNANIDDIECANRFMRSLKR